MVSCDSRLRWRSFRYVYAELLVGRVESARDVLSKVEARGLRYIAILCDIWRCLKSISFQDSVVRRVALLLVISVGPFSQLLDKISAPEDP